MKFGCLTSYFFALFLLFCLPLPAEDINIGPDSGPFPASEIAGPDSGSVDVSGSGPDLSAIAAEPGSGPDFFAVVAANPELAGTVYSPYSPRAGEISAAPSGFKPFYISHYGRHGCRYYTSASYFSAWETLSGLKKAGLLSPEGERLFDEYASVRKAHEKMYGELTPRGAAEHKGISDRMYRRFRRVFRSRKEVRCVASTVPRCIMSMASFTTQLKGNAPDLNISYITGQKYFEVLCHGYNAPGFYDFLEHTKDSIDRATARYDKLFSRIFNDKDAAISMLKDPYSLAAGIYTAGAICPDVDFLGADIFAYFDPAELASFAIADNNRMYGSFGNSVEWGDMVKASARDLARDFVERADEAIAADSPVAADLRFGHDSGIMPLLDLLEVDGCDVRVPVASADKVWFAHYQVPMATNFQMIFYRNRKREILVKMLYNEAETVIKAVPAYFGPYYRWSDLKAWILSR